MKNLGILILGIILGGLAMYFYCCNTNMEIASEVPDETIKGLISPKQAKALDLAYNIKYKIINDSLFNGSKTGDNRSSWWALEDIQNYINHAENQSGKLGYSMDGLRLYLGSYPGKNGERGLTTMFFVPTGTVNTSQGNMSLMTQGGSGDIKGADCLNLGQQGDPPGNNYPK